MIDPTELARTLHGHVGLLASIALVHPAITLRDDGALRRGTRWSLWLSTGLLTVTVCAGSLLYPDYRLHDKPSILRHDFHLAMWFETKEHLAWYALVLAWAGLGLGARREGRLCYRLAAALTLCVGIIGSFVGSFTRG